MRPLLYIFVSFPLLAQQAVQPSAQQVTAPAPASSAAQAPAPTAAQTPAPAAQATNAASPVPSTEPVLTGTIDLGYVWVTGVGGSYDTYRSIVDVHSGPKLLGTDLTLTDPKHRWFDTITLTTTTFGAEPSESAHLEAKKSGIYDFNADFRDFAYYNFLPSYADPLLGQGIMYDEQSFDTRRKIIDLSLDVRPGNWWTPYFGWDHDGDSGTGTSVFVTDGNQYPVPSTQFDSTDLYRAGVRFEKRRFQVTLEEGGTHFKSDQGLFQGSGQPNFGNFGGPIFGQTLDLTNLLAGYGAEGTSAYTKALLTVSPASWIDIYGQFLYSQPNTNVNYQQAAQGNLYLQNQVLFYSGEQAVITAVAEQPHTTASLGAEIRPIKHVRIVENWMTDRMHDAGSSAATQALLSSLGTIPLASLLETGLATNYSQEAINIFYDPVPRLALQGGYRYVWGDGMYAFLPPAGLASADNQQLRQNVGMGSVTFRPSQKISTTGEFEASSSSGVYFRTSLYNYQKIQAIASYQPIQSLRFAADFMLLNNQNPLAGNSYYYTSHEATASLYWTPRASKVFDIQGSYSRTELKSNISYLVPQTLSPALSTYRDNAHTATALVDFTSPRGKRFVPKLSAGGSLFISSGSRPSSYYLPIAKLFVPLGKRVAWYGEWQYFGYGEAFYLYEGFRTNLVTTGVRITP